MAAAPRVDIDLKAFWSDPYPTLARLRDEAPIAYVPQLDAVLFTRRDAKPHSVDLDVSRDTRKSIAFGAGPHFCAGAAASRALIAEVALPSLFARLKNLRLADDEVRFVGWAFRGPLSLRVAWDEAKVD